MTQSPKVPRVSMCFFTNNLKSVRPCASGFTLHMTVICCTVYSVLGDLIFIAYFKTSRALLSVKSAKVKVFRSLGFPLQSRGRFSFFYFDYLKKKVPEF